MVSGFNNLIILWFSFIFTWICYLLVNVSCSGYRPVPSTGFEAFLDEHTLPVSNQLLWCTAWKCIWPPLLHISGAEIMSLNMRTCTHLSLIYVWHHQAHVLFLQTLLDCEQHLSQLEKGCLMDSIPPDTVNCIISFRHEFETSMADDLHTNVVLAALSEPLKNINDLIHTRKVLSAFTEEIRTFNSCCVY